MMEPVVVFLLAVLAAVIGALMVYFYAKGRISALTDRLSMTEKENVSLHRQEEENRQQMNALVEERSTLRSRRDVLQERVDYLARQVDEVSERARIQKEEIITQFEQQLATVREERDRQLSELRAQQQQQLAELRHVQAENMEQQSQLLREQIRRASEEILTHESQQLFEANNENLAAILSPLKDKLKLMREAVEKSDREHTTSMERLDAAIKANLNLAREVGDRADKLAKALTADNKTQGNFGELRLRTLLEDMGFEEGTQFEEQVLLRDGEGKVIQEEEQGHRMIPDVILHFPDKRDVVIDSKMSMRAFEEYYHTDDEKERQSALKRHITSVRNHVKELAHKNYSRYVPKGHLRPDFVIMYVFNEGALQLALANDPLLYREAYEQGVIIAGSQSMYMMLRVLEMTWRQVRQAENQEEIMRAANDVVSRVQLFYERFLHADELLKRTQDAFDKLKTSTSPHGQGIVSSVNKLLDYGAKENPKRKQRLPKISDTGEKDSQHE